MHMGLFQHPHRQSHIRKQTGAVTNTAGFSLIGETQTLVHPRLSHLDLSQDRFRFPLDGRDRPRRADISTLHAENTALLAGNDIGGIQGT